jgi:hypothetical protein
MKNLSIGGVNEMLRQEDPSQLYIEDFDLQFGGKLRKDSRWVEYAVRLPWETHMPNIFWV